MTWLTVMEYMRHKWPHIYSTCRKQFQVLSSFMTYHGCVTAYPSGAPGFTPWFWLGSRYSIFSYIYICFVDGCLTFCSFSFGQFCVVCFSSIYGFWLPLWYLQTRLAYFLLSLYSMCIVHVRRGQVVITCVRSYCLINCNKILLNYLKKSHIICDNSCSII